ncbi:MAG: hypothetical protein AAB467_02990 [Patescibacteria group bacterium]
MFRGEPNPYGGLSNENELAEACPAEFKIRNPWVHYVELLFRYGFVRTDWIWKTTDELEQLHQLECFYGLVNSFKLERAIKYPIIAWMLSEMLTEIPLYPTDRGV